MPTRVSLAGSIVFVSLALIAVIFRRAIDSGFGSATTVASRSDRPTMGDQPGFRSVIYFVNWAIYGRDHHPQDLPADKLTHVLYSFANVRPDSGEVYLTDSWSDVEKHYPTDSWNDVGTNLYGCLKQLNLLKKQHRQLHVLLSIGGWTYSPNFAAPASTPAGRATFARTAAALVGEMGLDGIDIDWEYPQDAAQAQHYVELLAACRSALNAYADRTSTPRERFELTVACPAGPANFERLRVAEMDRYLDFWNIMAYDYAGSWDSVAGHQANLFAARGNDAAATPFSSAAAVEFYTRAGVAASKLVLGCPLYGRAFQNTKGPGASFSGVGEGSWENGVWDWKALPRPDSSVETDGEVVASWCHDARKSLLGGRKEGTTVSFDTLEVGMRKAQWIRENGLGGVMWWESSGDRRGADSMVSHVVGTLDRLERRENVLGYPESKYDNLRNGFA